MDELVQLENEMLEKLNLYKESRSLPDKASLKESVKKANDYLIEEYKRELCEMMYADVSAMDFDDAEEVINLGRTNLLAAYMERPFVKTYKIVGLSGKDPRILRTGEVTVLFSDIDAYSQALSGIHVAICPDWKAKLRVFRYNALLHENTCERASIDTSKVKEDAKWLYGDLDKAVYGTYKTPKIGSKGISQQFRDVIISIFPQNFRCKNGKYISAIRQQERKLVVSYFYKYNEKYPLNNPYVLVPRSLRTVENEILFVLRNKYYSVLSGEDETVAQDEAVEKNGERTNKNYTSRLFLEPVDIRRSPDICREIMQLERESNIGYIEAPTSVDERKRIGFGDALIGVPVKSRWNGCGHICKVTEIPQLFAKPKMVVSIEYDTPGGKRYESYDMKSVLHEPSLEIDKQKYRQIMNCVIRCFVNEAMQCQSSLNNDVDKQLLEAEVKLRTQIEEAKAAFLARGLGDEIHLSPFDSQDCSRDSLSLLEQRKVFERQNQAFRFDTTKDTLYIHGGDISCEHEHHDVQSVTVEMRTQNGADVKINANYCWDCGHYFLHHKEYEWYQKKYDLCRLHLAFKGWAGETSAEPNSFSPLSLNDYNVSAKAGYSDDMRQQILIRIMTETDITKPQVMRYLRKFIDRNGKIIGNEEARAKWEKDLEFVRNYRLDEQENAGLKEPKQW